MGAGFLGEWLVCAGRWVGISHRERVTALAIFADDGLFSGHAAIVDCAASIFPASGYRNITGCSRHRFSYAIAEYRVDPRSTPSGQLITHASHARATRSTSTE